MIIRKLVKTIQLSSKKLLRDESWRPRDSVFINGNTDFKVPYLRNCFQEVDKISLVWGTYTSLIVTKSSRLYKDSLKHNEENSKIKPKFSQVPRGPYPALLILSTLSSRVEYA